MNEPTGISDEELWNEITVGDQIHRATALYALASHQYLRSDYSDAVPIAGAAQEIFRREGVPRMEGLAAQLVARNLHQLDRWDEALEPIAIATASFRVNADENTLADAIQLRASCFAKLDLPDLAVEAYGEAIALFESNKLNAKAAACAMALGNISGLQGFMTVALSAFERALTLSQAVEDLAGSGRAHERIALTLGELDRLEEAVIHLRDAVTIAEFLDDAEGIAFTQCRLGQTLVDLNQHVEALSLLTVAAAAFKGAGDFSSTANAELFIAHALTGLGQEDDALPIYQRVRAIFDGLGDASMAAEAEIHLVELLAGRGDSAAAEHRIRAVITQAEARGDATTPLEARTCLARILVGDTRYDEAAEILVDTSTDAWGKDRIGRTQYLVVQGISDFHRGLYPAAAERFCAVLAGGPIEGRLELHATAHEYLAAIADHEGRTDETATLLTKAVALFLAAGLASDARRLSANFLVDDSSPPSSLDVESAEQSPLGPLDVFGGNQ